VRRPHSSLEPPSAIDSLDFCHRLLGKAKNSLNARERQLFFIPGWLISGATFPGIILHEWAHKMFCHWVGVEVYLVQYFQFGQDVAGFVEHAEPQTYRQTVAISFGPLLINTIACFAFAVFARQAINGSLLHTFMLWLAISFGMHAFPSDQDTQQVLGASHKAGREGRLFLFIFTLPFIFLLRIANGLRVIWFDAIFAAIIILIGDEVGKSLFK